MIATLILLALTTVSCVTDVRWKKIYNVVTYPGVIAAVALAAARTWLATQTSASDETLALVSRVELPDSFLGLFAALGIMLVCYVLFQLGGGDVKLIGMMGAFLGLHAGLEALLWTFMIAFCAAIIMLIWRVGAVQLAWRAWRYLLAVLRVGPTPPVESDREVLRQKMHLASSALAATIWVVLERA